MLSKGKIVEQGADREGAFTPGRAGALVHGGGARGGAVRSAGGAVTVAVGQQISEIRNMFYCFHLTRLPKRSAGSRSGRPRRPKEQRAHLLDDVDVARVARSPSARARRGRRRIERVGAGEYKARARAGTHTVSAGRSRAGRRPRWRQ